MPDGELNRLLRLSDHDLFLELGRETELAKERAASEKWGSFSRNDGEKRAFTFHRLDFLIPPLIVVLTLAGFSVGISLIPLFLTALAALVAFVLLGIAREQLRRRRYRLEQDIVHKQRMWENSGRKQFAAINPLIRSALCEQWHACEKVKLYEDQTQLAMAVGDVLAATLSGLPIATISALVVKLGLKKFCNCT